jgi:hypothetical protein
VTGRVSFISDILISYHKPLNIFKTSWREIITPSAAMCVDMNIPRMGFEKTLPLLTVLQDLGVLYHSLVSKHECYIIVSGRCLLLCAFDSLTNSRNLHATLFIKSGNSTFWPKYLFVYLFLARQPPVGHGLLIHEDSRSHTTTHHSRMDSSWRVISSLQRPLPDNTQH